MTNYLTHNTMIVYDKDFYTCTIIVKDRMMIQEWKGFSTPEQFREGIDKSIEFCK